MRALKFAFALLLAAAHPQLTRGLAAQDPTARLEGRVSSDVIRAVQGITHGATANGLPVEPLIQKALEGGAKGVSDDRVIGAVRLLAARLEEVRGALRAAGISAPTPETIERGADALNSGFDARQVRELGQLSRPPYEPALMLHVAATLAELSVPPQQGLQLVKHMVQAGRAPNELLDLPSEVQAAVARGAGAAAAVEQLDAASGRGDERNAHGEEGGQGQQGEGAGEPGQQAEMGRDPHRP